MPRKGNVKTAPKRIWLTDDTRAAVQQWADANGTSFSAALEALTRLGLGQAPTEALAPIVVSVIRSEVQQQFHRVASRTVRTRSSFPRASHRRRI